VCLHGLGRSPSDWRGVTGGLEAFGHVRAPALPRNPAEALARADAIVEPGAIVVGHSLGGVIALRLAGNGAKPLRGVVLTGCFFPHARNGRSLAASARDFVGHRVALIRSLDPPQAGGESRAGTAGALASLIRLALRPGEYDSEVEAVRCPVLVVHARDDHHVPLDFALAAVARHPGWDLRILEEGGHHAHVTQPERWLAAVSGWLSALE
jgi:pimeloyl-ACP methyl ester carboxylesterase